MCAGSKFATPIERIWPSSVRKGREENGINFLFKVNSIYFAFLQRQNSAKITK
jgi:hypothetical protein